MMYPDKEWRATLARPDEGVRALHGSRAPLKALPITP